MMEEERYDVLREELEDIRRHVIHTKWLVTGVLALLVCLVVGLPTIVPVLLWLIPAALVIGAVVYGGLWFFEKVLAIKHGPNWSEARLEEELAAYRQEEAWRREADEAIDDREGE